MRPLHNKLVAFSLPVFTVILAINVFGQTTTTAVADDRLVKLETALTNAQMAGDNAWMLTCSALVLMMTGPGLALFYGGLVRKKNVLATMMQSFILMALVTVLWAIYGYSVAFSEGNAFFGNLNYIFLTGVGSAPNTNYAATIPHQTFMIYQLMFAIITPALITGAYAERIKFKAMLLFTILWVTIVYFPLAHMVWGKGGFLNAVLGGRVPALDQEVGAEGEPRQDHDPFPVTVQQVEDARSVRAHAQIALVPVLAFYCSGQVVHAKPVLEIYR